MIQEIISCETINRYRKLGQYPVVEADISHSEMKQIIYCYMQARFLNDPELESQAETLLEQLYASVSTTMPVCLKNGLLGIGCGLIYLLRNGLVEGEEDEVLADIDQTLSSAHISLEDEISLDWYGWLYYSRLRISYIRLPEQLPGGIFLREKTIYILDCLVRGIQKGMRWNEPVFSEIQEFHKLELCPVVTDKLLALFTFIENSQVTFVIPVRIDSQERERNLDLLLEDLTKIDRADILILEGDRKSCYRLKKEYANVEYHFVSDFDPVFHRTKYLNWLLKKAKGSVVGVWDTDVIIAEDQILKAIQNIRTGNSIMCFPYDGRFYLLTSAESTGYEKERSYARLMQRCEHYPLGFGRHSVGGAFLVNKKVYLQAGGENEHFYGWGPEDAERVKRMEILHLPISRIEGPLFHLYHPRKENSWYTDEETERQNKQEFLTVCGMTCEKLQGYIQSWAESGCIEKQNENDSIYRKQKKEAAFWKAEIEQYRLWYEGEVSFLYNTPSPLPAEKIVCDNPIHSYILTWTELHQKPKYLHELNADPRLFAGKKVLDVGAGPIPSATCFEDCELYVLDPLMSVYRKSGFPHHLYPKVHFVEAPAEKIPFEDNFFDVIISVNAIDHVDHLEKVAKELRRVAKPDCQFLMHVDYHKATICEPIEIDDDIFSFSFNWVKGLRVLSRSRHSYSSEDYESERFVLWGNVDICQDE